MASPLDDLLRLLSPRGVATQTYGTSGLLRAISAAQAARQDRRGVPESLYGQLPALSGRRWENRVPVLTSNALTPSGAAAITGPLLGLTSMVIRDNTSQNVLDHEMTHVAAQTLGNSFIRNSHESLRGEFTKAGVDDPFSQILRENPEWAAELRRLTPKAIGQFRKEADSRRTHQQKTRDYLLGGTEIVSFMTEAKRAFYRKHGRAPNTTKEVDQAIDGMNRYGDFIPEMLKALPGRLRLSNMLVKNANTNAKSSRTA